MKINSVKIASCLTLIKVITDENKRYTPQVPQFKSRLLQALPGLKYHKCYNSEDLSFPEELDNTSFAHVFEHVLLELIGEKITYKKNIKGFTSWNWYKEPRGAYEIEIHSGVKEVVLKSIDEASQIMEYCMATICSDKYLETTSV